jgi:hypothetical protein
MSALKEALAAMREVLLLTDKVDRAGTLLSEMAGEVREHDRRLIRLETMVELARMQAGPQGQESSRHRLEGE